MSYWLICDGCRMQGVRMAGFRFGFCPGGCKPRPYTEADCEAERLRNLSPEDRRTELMDGLVELDALPPLED